MANSFETERETPEYASIAELASNLVYRLPGCADEMVRRALRDAYGDFCRLANALVTERVMRLSVGESIYPITPLTPDCTITSISAVWHKSMKLKERYDYTVIVGMPPSIKLRHSYIPEDAEEEAECFIRVVCIEQPKSGSERAPRWLLQKYGDAICAGALVKLFGMTGRAWSDVQQMRMELVRWDNAVSGTRMAGMSGSAFGNGNIDAVDTSELL